MWKRLKEIGYAFPVICDPSAILAGDVQLGEGVTVRKNAEDCHMAWNREIVRKNEGRV